jgi:carboxyl-terminal processing protease
VTKKIILAILVFILVFTLLAGCFSVGVLAGRKMQKVQEERISGKGATSLEKVEEVLTIIKDTYVEKIPAQKLIVGAVKGMLESLNDPYSRYLDKMHFEMVEEEAAGHYEGVGIMLGMEDHKLTVISPIKDTPADRAGIKTGDRIMKIDGKSTKDMTINQAVKLIRGPAGTTVVLTIEREGEEKPLEFKLERARIQTPNVSSKMLDDNIGYIHLHFFAGGAGEDVKKAVKDLKAQGTKGIIFDMRNNPGGVLDESVNVASAFIDSGVIVKIKERKGDEEVLEAKDGGDGKIPLVVLVNKGSASASEIVAGAIQDTGRGVLVGETTFGKGSVQEIRRLSDGSGLLITVAKYLTPKGRSIHKKGIKPDVPVKSDPKVPLREKDPQLDKAKEIIKDIILGKDWKKAA